MTEPFDWFEPASDSQSLPIRVHHRVTAILVNRNGKTWVGRTHQSIARQSEPIDQVVVVDLDSDDGSEKTLALASDGQLFLRLPRDIGISGALDTAEAAAPASADAVEWLWILHDDSAPESDALHQLLVAADHHPHAAVVGAKIVDWRNPSHVLEVGVAFTAIGTRFTGLEHGERDQGQHDTIKPVMAVSSAGMLVRRDIWRALNGFNPALDHFRTDVEFCLRVWESGNEVIVAPAARVRHAAATARGLRKVEGHRGSAHFIDRYAGLTLALSRTNRRWLWLRWILVAIAGAIRSVAYFLVQDLAGARDETSATIAALLNRPKVVALRRLAGSAPVPRWLRPTLRQQISHIGTELLNTGQRVWLRTVNWLLPNRERVEDVGWLHAAFAALRRPGSMLSLASLIAGLALVWPAMGDGQLTLANGEMVPTAAGDLWREFTSGWHPVGFGSVLAAHPLQGLFGALSLLAGSSAALFRWWAVLGIWAAGASMHLAMRRLLKHAPTRVWLAALYAFSPPVLTAVAGGDVGTVMAAVLLPVFVQLVPKLAHSWRIVAVAALVFAVLIAVWPALILLAFGVIAVAAWRLRPSRWLLVRWLAVPVWAFALDLPWSYETLLMPDRWFRQFGVAQSGEAIAAAAVVGVPDFVHGFGWWWSAGLLAVAIGAWIDKRNRNVQQVLWSLLVAIVATALAGQLAGAVKRTGDWQPSLSLVAVACVGLLVASIASAATFVRVKLSRADFGWRQITALIAAAVVAVMPVASLVTALRSPDTERMRVTPAVSGQVLRGYSPDLRLRTLWLQTGVNSQVDAQLLDGRALMFGDLAVADRRDRDVIANSIVTWLTRSSANEMNPLRRFAVGFIAVPFGDPVSRRISAMGGLKRLITARNANLPNVWQLTDVNSRAYIGNGLDPAELLQDVTAPPAAAEVRGVILPPAEDTSLTLADRNDPGWTATLDGQPLEQQPSVELSWVLPAAKSGRAVVTFSGSDRIGALLAPGLALAIAALVIAPRRRRSYEEEWLDES